MRDRLFRINVGAPSFDSIVVKVHSDGARDWEKGRPYSIGRFLGFIVFALIVELLR